MAVNQEVMTNPVVVEAMAWLMTKMPCPVTHGEFNRRMFLEAIAFVAGTNISTDRESIVEYAAITDKEFNEIEAEYVTKGIIKKEKNMFNVVMYSLQLTPNSAGLTNG